MLNVKWQMADVEKPIKIGEIPFSIFHHTFNMTLVGQLFKLFT